MNTKHDNSRLEAHSHQTLNCKQCGREIPEWSFICPICFCNEENE